VTTRNRQLPSLYDRTAQQLEEVAPYDEGMEARLRTLGQGPAKPLGRRPETCVRHRGVGVIYICVPVHNEESTIGVLLWKIRKVMAEFDRGFQVLVLDDASTDETPEVLESYRRAVPLTVIRSDERLGHGRATARLLQEASAATSYPKRDVAVTLQGDFTEDPEALVDMVKAIEGGADLVAGALDDTELPRAQRLARWGSRVLLGRVVREAPVSDPLAGFRAYRIIVLRKALRQLEEEGEAHLVTRDGWAGNLELLARTAPHARRVEESPFQMRFQHRQRESRFHPWEAIKAIFPLRKMAWPVTLLLALLVAAGPATEQLQAQTEPPPWAGPVESGVAPVPFGPGERAEYQVRLGRISVGEGHMAVHGVENVRGNRSYHLSMGVSGGIPLARVNNLYQSWLDLDKLSAHRFIQDQNEIRTERFRHFEFFPAEGRWTRVDVDEEGDLATDLPLDDISFVYYVRSLPLEVGETYVLDRYFRDRGNPVIVEVVRRDTVEVPAGTFETIVVEPTIQTRGLFGEGGEAEIHFSDDEHRILVQMRSRVPVIGSLSLHLKDVSYGTPLRSFSPVEVEELSVLDH
jgi:hypothetical protein